MSSWAQQRSLFWTGWATLAFSIVMLVQLLAKGDTLPAYHYLPGLVIGILLLFGG